MYCINERFWNEKYKLNLEQIYTKVNLTLVFITILIIFKFKLHDTWKISDLNFDLYIRYWDIEVKFYNSAATLTVITQLKHSKLLIKTVSGLKIRQICKLCTK